MIAAAFVGYLVAGFWGAIVSALDVFLPVYLFVILIGKYILKYRQHPVMKGFIKGATSAATGAICGATVILAEDSIKDIPTALIGFVSLLLLWRLKVPEPFLIIAGAAASILLYQR